MPCSMVRQFHVLQFHALRFGRSISCTGNSCPVQRSAKFMSCIFRNSAHPSYRYRQKGDRTTHHRASWGRRSQMVIPSVQQLLQLLLQRGLHQQSKQHESQQLLLLLHVTMVGRTVNLQRLQLVQYGLIFSLLQRVIMSWRSQGLMASTVLLTPLRQHNSCTLVQVTDRPVTSGKDGFQFLFLVCFFKRKNLESSSFCFNGVLGINFWYRPKFCAQTIRLLFLYYNLIFNLHEFIDLLTLASIA